MASTWFATLISVIVISLISLIGVATLSLDSVRLRRWLLYLVSFAAGAMLGDAFLHLAPEVFRTSTHFLKDSTFILVGLVAFFILEKAVFWRHCHLPTTETHAHPFGLMNLIGDSVHNFLDGAVIAGSFLVSVPLGLTTTLAVILHEIPQEIGDFGVLVHAGYTPKRAIFFNFLTALTSILGAVLTLSVGFSIASISNFIVPLTIGGFVYIAAADLIPEIHGEQNTRRSSLQVLYFLFGIGIMGLLLLVA